MGAACIKGADWDKESEWRLFFLPGITMGIQKEKMPTPSIVYLGCKIPQDQETRIYNICKRRNIPIKKMWVNPMSQEFEPTDCVIV